MTREEAWTAILVSIVASIPACHAGDPGSIPGRGASFSLSFLSAPRCCSSLPSLLGVHVATGACLVCWQPLAFGATCVARSLSFCLLFFTLGARHGLRPGVSLLLHLLLSSCSCVFAVASLWLCVCVFGFVVVLFVVVWFVFRVWCLWCLCGDDLRSRECVCVCV